MNSAASSVMVLKRSAFDPVVLPFEGHACLVERNEPGVRDRDPVGVAGEIGEHGFRSGEGLLGVDDPLGPAQRRECGVEGALVGELGEIAEEDEAAGLMPGCEAFEKEAAEQAREDAHRQEEAGLAGDPARALRRQPPPGTMTCTCGWWVSAEPQVCRTAVRPMRAPRCLGSAAIVISVSAAVLKRRS